jgi:dTDP-4-amino-4,6-dideoxygalactose transaminase
LPFPFGGTPAPGRLFYLARTAIVQGLRELALQQGAVCLMPAYHHGVEVEAVRAAGLEARFYRVDRRGRIDLEDIRRRIDGRVRVLYATHFFGFPAPIRDLRRLADEHGLLLLEDCALAFLSADSSGQPLGQTGHLSIFCLYKSVPVPHGGVLVSPSSRGAAPFQTLASPPLLATLSHMAGSLVRRNERRGHMAAVRAMQEPLRRFFRLLPIEARMPIGRQHLRPHELELGGSALVGAILRAQPVGEIISRRRSNYERLRQAIARCGFVPSGELVPGTCPLFVPVWVRDRDAVLAHLASRRIEAVDLWRQGFEPHEEFPDTQALRRHLIELPCHQDLEDEDVDRVAHAFLEATR